MHSEAVEWPDILKSRRPLHFSKTKKVFRPTCCRFSSTFCVHSFARWSLQAVRRQHVQV